MNITQTKFKIQSKYLTKKYQFQHWIFSWSVDEDEAVVFSIAKIIHFIKYKEHTIVSFGKKNYQPAPKYF